MLQHADCQKGGSMKFGVSPFTAIATPSLWQNALPAQQAERGGGGISELNSRAYMPSVNASPPSSRARGGHV